jgi:transposase InsO family protein
MKAALELSITVGRARACGALAIPRASFYRSFRVHPWPTQPLKLRPSPARALTKEERVGVAEVLNSDRFADLAPRQIYATLLDEDTYLCSIRTMYRILESLGQARERRDQLRHPKYQRPELVATAPNQIWSWDITKLLGPVKWTYFYLYVVLDIFSRYVVAFMVATRENSQLAKQLIDEACTMQDVQPGQLTVHADRGSAMTSKTIAQFYADLGITQSHSRPHVSDDNPYSEAQFKTFKYRPGFPDRFGSIQHARAVSRDLIAWYNNVHYHTGIGLLTPAAVHYGQANAIRQRRNEVLARVYAAHPERFVTKPPSAPDLAPVVWINPPRPIELAEAPLPDRLPGQPDLRSSILAHPGASLPGQTSPNGPREPALLEVALH